MNLHHLANIKCAIHLLEKSVLFTQCDTGAQKYTQRLKPNLRARKCTNKAKKPPLVDHIQMEQELPFPRVTYSSGLSLSGNIS